MGDARKPEMKGEPIAGGASQRRQRWDIFLVHASQDKPLVRLLHAALSQQCRCFLDELCLEPGERWLSVLAAAQTEARMSVICISPHFDDAYYAMEELTRAVSRMRSDPNGHQVIPLYLQGPPRRGDRVPYGLASLQSLWITNPGDVGRIASQLIEALKGVSPLVAARDSDGLIKVETAPGHLLDLRRYGPGPVVNAEWLDPSIRKAYAERFDQIRPALDVLTDAARLVHQLDPRAPVVRPSEVTTSGPADSLWWDAFDRARKEGPRMLAALLLIVPPGSFEPEVEKRRLALLAKLAAMVQ